MIRTDVLDTLEQIQDGERFGKRPAEIIKDVITDILAYGAAINDTCLIPIGEADMREEKDRIRTSKHNKVIADINMLRRMCNMLVIDDLFDSVEFHERKEYADAAFELLGIYMHRN